MSGTVGLSDILTAIKNLVTATNGLATTYLNVQGQRSLAAISAPTVASAQAGRLAWVEVTTAGSGPGVVYDSAALAALTRPIHVIPNTVGGEPVILAVNYGIVVVPGAGQVVTVGYT